tara:strand:- start:9243 stop:12206 length:2964 start_codon:yes stop_codon:yes gene_type:complete
VSNLFNEWNDRLLKYFFGDFAQGEQVRIAVTDELLDSEFDDLGGKESFKKALKVGTRITSGENGDSDSLFKTCNILFSRLKYQLSQCSKRNNASDFCEGPQYFIYLCAFCLAWTQESDEFQDSNYYDRLNLIYPNHHLNQLFGQLEKLWEGLESWTQLNDGKIGYFKVEKLGNKQWVGLPKSQVILTPGKIEKIPELFYDLALAPDDPLSATDLQLKILDEKFSDQDFPLGKHILKEVKENTELGKSTLSQLLEHFQIWDGQVPIRRKGSSTLSDDKKLDDAAIVAGLEYLQDVQGWRYVQMPLIPQSPDGELTLTLEGNAGTYKSQLRNGIGSPFIATEDKNKFLFLSEIESLSIAPIIWRTEFEGEKEIVSVVERPKKIQCFDWSPDGKYLIQKQSLPSEGSVYALVNKTVTENFEKWCYDAGVSIDEQIPQNGLGENERLFYIKQIGSADAYQWSMFPDGGCAKRRRPRRLTLIGGSRQRRERATQTYLPFDPPTLKVEAEGTISFECKNCLLEEIDGSNKYLPNWVSQSSGTRFFEIDLNQGATVATIQAYRNGGELEKVSFRILNRDDFEPVVSESYKVNRFGLKETDNLKEGIRGVSTPGASHFSFEEAPYDSWTSCNNKVEGPPYTLMDWLATQGTTSYARLKTFCEKRLINNEARQGDLANEIKALFKLGHIEIQGDDRGRWSYVHSTIPIFYPLPFLADGKYQFVLSGTYTSDLVNRVKSLCDSNPNLTLDRHPQLGGNTRGHWLVPSRITVFTPDFNELVNLGRIVEIKVIETPPSWDMANWIASSDELVDELRWHVGGGEYAEASYRPRLYRTKAPPEWPEWDDGTPVNFNLVRIPDPQTKKHFNYVLVKKDDQEFSRALCSNKAWGIWFMHRNMLMARFGDLLENGIPMAYEPIERALVLPIELDPPPLFSKALALCSGFAPLRLLPGECKAYLSSDFGFTYEDTCIKYRSVPKPLADLLLTKLGAIAKEFEKIS